MVFWLQIRGLAVYYLETALKRGQDNSSRAASMRKFLELARMTLMEDIVAIGDSDRIHELSSAAQIASTTLRAIVL
jgi:hypothetical protein